MAMDEKNVRMGQETEIDLLEIAHLLWTRIWLILAGFIAGAVIAFTFTKFFITPQYKADSIIYIFSKTTSISSLADLQIGSQLTGDFTIIATTREVINSVIDELGLDMTYETLVKNVSVTNPTSSHMLKIAVKNPSPQLAAQICNSLSEKLREQIADIMNTDKPSVVQRAIVPQKKDSPNTTRNTEIGALIGVVLVAGFLIVRYLLDDTIKTDEDVKKYLGVDVLAAFPYVRGIDSKHGKNGKAGKNGKKKKTASSGRVTQRQTLTTPVVKDSKTRQSTMSEESRTKVKETLAELAKEDLQETVEETTGKGEE